MYVYIRSKNTHCNPLGNIGDDFMMILKGNIGDDFMKITYWNYNYKCVAELPVKLKFSLSHYLRLGLLHDRKSNNSLSIIKLITWTF